MLLSSGVECVYITEYMNRPPIACEVVEHVDRTNRNTEIFLVALPSGKDKLLGEQIYVEAGPIEGLKDPENIVPVRTYLARNAWKHTPVRFGQDVIENAFICTQSAYQKYFRD